MLAMARAKVTNYILNKSTTDEFSWKELTQYAKDWFSHYKQWEKEDALYLALKEKRLMVRIIKSSGLTGTVASIESDADLLPVLFYQRATNAQGHQITKASRNNPTPEQEDYRKNNSVAVSKRYVGLELRRDPKNFEKGSGDENRKHELGLHAQCYSLLNPEGFGNENYSIKAQLWHQAEKPEDIANARYIKPHLVLYYCPNPQDNTLAALMSSISRSGPSEDNEYRDYCRFVEHFKARMTRVKLAASHDFGSKPVVVYSRGRYRVKIVPDPAKHVEGILRKTAVDNYTSVLDGQQGGHTEMVVCIRSRANPDIPLCVPWDISKTSWPFVDYRDRQPKVGTLHDNMQIS